MEIEISNSLNLELKTEWEDIDYKDYKLFDVLPAIYKWSFWIDNEKSVYIGETVNLRNRISHYLNPGKTQQTNIRLNENYIKKSNKVILQKLKINKFSINKKNILANLNQIELLKNIYYRKLIENLLLINTSEDVLNSNGRKKI